MPDKPIMSQQPNAGWISLAAQAAGIDRSGFRRYAVKNVEPGQRVFPGSNGQLCLASTLDEARQLLDQRLEIGRDFPAQQWELN